MNPRQNPSPQKLEAQTALVVALEKRYRGVKINVELCETLTGSVQYIEACAARQTLIKSGLVSDEMVLYSEALLDGREVSSRPNVVYSSWFMFQTTRADDGVWHLILTTKEADDTLAYMKRRNAWNHAGSLVSSVIETVMSKR